MLIPADKNGHGIILEFKSIAYDNGEKSLEDSVAAALKQIREKNYAAGRRKGGVLTEGVRK